MSEWITDRLPTEEDADEKFRVWRTSPDGDVFRCYYSLIGTGEAWAPKPKTVKPAPYVKPEPQRWKPEIAGLYWVLDNNVSRAFWYNHNIDQHRFALGNCFQTREQAKEAERRVGELLLNYHKELNNE